MAASVAINKSTRKTVSLPCSFTGDEGRKGRATKMTKEGEGTTARTTARKEQRDEGRREERER